MHVRAARSPSTCIFIHAWQHRISTSAIWVRGIRSTLFCTLSTFPRLCISDRLCVCACVNSFALLVYLYPVINACLHFVCLWLWIFFKFFFTLCENIFFVFVSLFLPTWALCVLRVFNSSQMCRVWWFLGSLKISTTPSKVWWLH